MERARSMLRHAVKATVILLAISRIAGPVAAAETAPEWQALLKKIVDIDSGTRNVEGLEAVRRALIPAFEKLGFTAVIHDLDAGHKLVSMTVPGGEPALLLMGHIDTVFPKDSDFRNYKVRGDRIFGPGVIDMKAGIVMMKGLLERLGDTDLPRKIMVVINDDEEIGSPYSHALTRRLAAGLEAGLIFEPGLPGGAVVTAQSGVRWLTLSVRGKASHAGLEPEKGINACVELAHKIVEISKLSDYSRKLSVNVGVIEGGTEPNVVCDRAEAKIDMRFVEMDDAEKTQRAIRNIADRHYVANSGLAAAPTATLKTVVAIPALPPSRTARLFGLLQTAGRRVGQKVEGRWVGYVSDANQLADTGMDLLVGLGPYGEGMHTKSEYLTISTYEERLALTEALVREILK